MGAILLSAAGMWSAYTDWRAGERCPSEDCDHIRSSLIRACLLIFGLIVLVVGIYSYPITVESVNSLEAPKVECDTFNCWIKFRVSRLP